MITLSWLLLIALAAGIVALVDGIIRARGRGTSVIAIIEIIAAALFLLSLFFPAIPFGALTLAIITLIVLVVAVVLPGRSRGLTIVGLVLFAVWIVLTLRWIAIPGVN